MILWRRAATGARLLLESAQPLGVGRKARGQHFDRDLASEPRVARAGLTATHADLVNRDLLAFCQQGKQKAA